MVRGWNTLISPASSSVNTGVPCRGEGRVLQPHQHLRIFGKFWQGLGFFWANLGKVHDIFGLLNPTVSKSCNIDIE